MARHGFVYILGNSAMPGRYKIGHTFNSPFERAKDLSRATGVPCAFTVLGFAGFENPERHERELHERFKAIREPGREFFQCPLEPLWRALVENEDSDCLCDVEVWSWIAYHEPESMPRTQP